MYVVALSGWKSSAILESWNYPHEVVFIDDCLICLLLVSPTGRVFSLIVLSAYMWGMFGFFKYYSITTLRWNFDHWMFSS